MRDTQSHAMARQALAVATGYRRLFESGGTEGAGLLRPADVQVLLALLLEPSRTVSDVARQLELRPQTVSASFTRLVAQELGDSEPGEDGRTRRLRLTKKGERRAATFIERALSVELPSPRAR